MGSRHLLPALVSAAAVALVASLLVGGCGGGGGPPLLGVDGESDASLRGSTTPGTTGAPGAGSVGGNAVADADACLSLDALLQQYSLQAECSPCIDVACASQMTACNASCTCPLAVANYVNCVGLGASSATCGAVAAASTNPQTVLSILMCTYTCKDDCHLVAGLDASDDGGSEDGAASDAAEESGGGGDAGAADGATDGAT